MTVQWWCSARGAPWTWNWEAYPGVWLACGAVALAVYRVTGAMDSSSRRAASITGAVLLWLTLDWPIGPLGAGYLASVHALQFISLAMLVPPLLLVGIDANRVQQILNRHNRVRRCVSIATQPVVAAVVFNLVMAVTHAPQVVDGFMRNQAGAFALDLAWLAGGLLFWWPVVLRAPDRPHFPAPARMLYLFLGTQGHLLLAMWLLTADFPVYATYELAPRVTQLSAMVDQQVAGSLMIVVAEPVIFAAITVVFLRWARRIPLSDIRLTAACLVDSIPGGFCSPTVRTPVLVNTIATTREHSRVMP